MQPFTAQVGQAAWYVVKSTGDAGLNAIRDLVIVFLGIEAGMAGGGKDAYWLQLQVNKEDGTALVATVLVDDPILSAEHTARVNVLRYIYQEGEHEPIEYVNAIRGGAEATPFGLMENFFPQFAAGDLEKALFPERGKYLGLPIERVRSSEHDAAVPEDVMKLALDPELLIGTSRNFRDVSGQRDFSGDDYEYRKFVEADYDEMIEAGINYFRVNARQETWIWRKPVFYLIMRADQIRWPEMFYRGNCRGLTMFMDEPAIHLGWHYEDYPQEAKQLAGPAGAARELERRVKTTYEHGSYSRNRLHDMLDARYDLGDLVIDEDHYPAWETQEWSVYYQLKAGLPGAVHEGRYTNKADVNAINAQYNVHIPDTPENNMKIRFAWFRGAARVFDGDWGIAIYGQCERSIAPLAIKQAYDAGARYIWYWTSDRLHHMPYPEQLALTRQLRAHQAENPRPPLSGLKKRAKLAIVLPDGYTLSNYSMWGTPVFHLDRMNRFGLRYREVLQPAALQIERCLREDIPFDLIYHDGTGGWKLYDEAVIVSEDGSAMWYRDGERRGEPPLPDRPAEVAQRVPLEIHIRRQPDEDGNPLSVKLTAEIEHADGPVGLRCRDWGTDKWTWLEAFWFIYDDPAAPRFVPGRTVEHTFSQPGTYHVTVWTCNEDGVPARDAREIIVGQ